MSKEGAPPPAYTYNQPGQQPQGYGPGPGQPMQGYSAGPAQPGYAPTQPGYGPPPPGYGQPQGGNTTVVVTQPGVVLHSARLGESPAQMRCPHCSAQIVTSTSYETGSLTWLAAGIICLVGCWAGCCLIPFCIDGCKDVIHTCPSCRAHVGSYRRL